jgi:hypothetical protein
MLGYPVECVLSCWWKGKQALDTKSMVLTCAHIVWLCVRAGESDPIKKNPEEDPWIRSGTQVRSG